MDRSIQVLRGICLKEYTTFRIGGSAEYFLEVRNLSELKSALKLFESVTVLGQGSNVLISDLGVKGLVLRMCISDIFQEGDLIAAGSGVKLSELSAFYRKNEFTGLEWARGIPGSIGGAVKMNAGAFGFCTADCVTWVEVLREGAVVRLSPQECNFLYRGSGFYPSDIIIRAGFRYSRGDKQSIKWAEQQYIQNRRDTQPGGRTAGSVFKAAELPAGWYIDRAGFKGKRVGEAEISKKHANFIINTGNAKARDVLSLIDLVKDGVQKKFGVRLEEEIQWIGEL